jgi:hypothetical protein
MNEQRQQAKEQPPRVVSQNAEILKSTRVKRATQIDSEKVYSLINREDLNIRSTKTKRATNLEKLDGLESILTKQYNDLELNLHRSKMEHSMMMELTLSQSKVEQDPTPVNSGKPRF